jgi:hypothetical protein
MTTTPRAKATQSLPLRSVAAKVAGGAGIAGALGTPAVIAATNPLLSVGIFGAEFLLALLVVLTFLFGSENQIERFFRLLRWFKGEAEPAPPTTLGHQNSPTTLLADTNQVERFEA